MFIKKKNLGIVEHKNECLQKKKKKGERFYFKKKK